MVSIAPRSANLTPICERFLGSVRRECLDHIVASAGAITTIDGRRSDPHDKGQTARM